MKERKRPAVIYSVAMRGPEEAQERLIGLLNHVIAVWRAGNPQTTVCGQATTQVYGGGHKEEPCGTQASS